MTRLTQLLDDFIARVPREAAANGLRLRIEVHSVDGDDVEFKHMGAVFHVHLDDFVSAAAVTSTSASLASLACDVVLRRDAEVWRTTYWRAVDLVSGLPFPMARPSYPRRTQIPDYLCITWLRERGLLSGPGTHKHNTTAEAISSNIGGTDA